ncbi:MAG TPA: hypothetical protein VK900_08625 [Anaerolineales bacterium]|nr:hypothetical protein [Anaerolineales bacterium]
MSTLRTRIPKLLARLVPQSWRKALAGLMPETDWQDLELPTYDQIVERLQNIDQLGPGLLEHARKRKHRIGFFSQASSGAGWTVLGNITLRPEDREKLFEPYILSLIVHEMFHLQNQSLLMRLSMQGELDAWQYQCRTYPYITKTGAAIGSLGEAYCSGERTTHEIWEQLSGLSSASRADLEKARDLMIAIAPGYRAYRLPLYPLHREIWFHLRQGKFGEASRVIRSLFVGTAPATRVGEH